MSSPWKFARFVLTTTSIAILVWPRIKQAMIDSAALADEEVPLGAESSLMTPMAAANEPPGYAADQD